MKLVIKFHGKNAPAEYTELGEALTMAGLKFRPIADKLAVGQVELEWGYYYWDNKKYKCPVSVKLSSYIPTLGRYAHRRIQLEREETWLDENKLKAKIAELQRLHDGIQS